MLTSMARWTLSKYNHFSTGFAFLVCMGSLGLGLQGCASKDNDPTEKWSPNKIYFEAKEEADADKAVRLLEKLEGRAAGTPLSQQAVLEQAYRLYKDNQVPKALAAVESFMRQYPASPAMDYALYLKGLIHFQDQVNFLSRFVRQDPSERDQEASRMGYLAYEELVKRFPNSKYAAQATARMDYIVNNLAQHDVNIARFYYRQGAYLAAANRAQQAIAQYRKVPALEQAIYVLYQSYDKLGLPQLRDDTLRVMQNSFPNSRYIKEGLKENKGFFSLW